MPALFLGRCWPSFSSIRSTSVSASVFYLAVIPGLLAFLLVLLVREQPAAVAAKIGIDPRAIRTEQAEGRSTCDAGPVIGYRLLRSRYRLD